VFGSAGSASLLASNALSIFMSCPHLNNIRQWCLSRLNIISNVPVTVSRLRARDMKLQSRSREVDR
jgi:hypothetical protein